ncbi:MAG: hypothetical protein JW702_07150 [Clostridiales bacterium]|nr:hypothetical protein [Clostridiales bacterium]
MKNMVIKLSFSFLFSISIAFSANCTDWHVDNAATGANNSTSPGLATKG